ncbi:hypothetical protein VB319_22555, partial [Vibrio parahaemolyticus]|nr:hypothetical protein [Vibrio parahaemolyticus]
MYNKYTDFADSMSELIKDGIAIDFNKYKTELVNMELEDYFSNTYANLKDPSTLGAFVSDLVSVSDLYFKFPESANNAVNGLALLSNINLLKDKASAILSDIDRTGSVENLNPDNIRDFLIAGASVVTALSSYSLAYPGVSATVVLGGVTFGSIATVGAAIVSVIGVVAVVTEVMDIDFFNETVIEKAERINVLELESLNNIEQSLETNLSFRRNALNLLNKYNIDMGEIDNDILELINIDRERLLESQAELKDASKTSRNIIQSINSLRNVLSDIGLNNVDIGLANMILSKLDELSLKNSKDISLIDFNTAPNDIIEIYKYIGNEIGAIRIDELVNEKHIQTWDNSDISRYIEKSFDYNDVLSKNNSSMYSLAKLKSENFKNFESVLNEYFDRYNLVSEKNQDYSYAQYETDASQFEFDLSIFIDNKYNSFVDELKGSEDLLFNSLLREVLFLEAESIFKSENIVNTKASDDFSFFLMSEFEGEFEHIFNDINRYAVEPYFNNFSNNYWSDIREILNGELALKENPSIVRSKVREDIESSYNKYISSAKSVILMYLEDIDFPSKNELNEVFKNESENYRANMDQVVDGWKIDIDAALSADEREVYKLINQKIDKINEEYDSVIRRWMQGELTESEVSTLNIRNLSMQSGKIELLKNNIYDLINGTSDTNILEIIESKAFFNAFLYLSDKDTSNEILQSITTDAKKIFDFYADMIVNAGNGILDDSIEQNHNNIEFPFDDLINELQELQNRIRKDPLILDLNGDGISTIGLENQVFFDHDGDGFKENTGWVNPNDGILSIDLNGDGIISTGRELFGDNSIIGIDQESNPIFAEHGFHSLSFYDSNNDGIINSSDEKWADLNVWVDMNSDGINQSYENFTLETLNISSISLDSESSGLNAGNGNTFGFKGSYTDIFGQNHEIANLNFINDTTNGKFSNDIEINEEVNALPKTNRMGIARSLQESMMISDELKNIVLEFISSDSKSDRNEIMDRLLFSWASTSTFDDYFDRNFQSSPESFGIINNNSITVYDKIAISEIFSGKFLLNSSPNQISSVNFSSVEKFYDDLKQYVYKALIYGSSTNKFNDFIITIAEGNSSILDLEDKLINLNDPVKSSLIAIDLFDLYRETLKDWDVVNFIRNKVYSQCDIPEVVASYLEEYGVFIVNNNQHDFSLSLDYLKEINPILEYNKEIVKDESYIILGNSLENNLSGSIYVDYINGGAGDDVIDGGYGKDSLIGGEGNDVLGNSSVTSDDY